MPNQPTTHPELPEERVGALLRQAGSPPELGHDARKQVRQAVAAQWQNTLRQRRNRVLRMAAAVAGILVAAGLLFAGLRPAPAPAAVAQLGKHLGSVSVAAGSRGEARPVSGEASMLYAGAIVTTGSESGLALRYNNDLALRLGPETIIEAVSSEELRLVAGQLYVDSGTRGSHRKLSVLTAWGRVDHVGTQYRVETDGTSLLVAVREGRVSVTRRSGRHTAMAGRQLELSANGTVVRTEQAASDPAWQWVESLAAPFPADNRSVAELLAWTARETGRSVEFATPTARQLATTTVLFGQVDAPPERTLGLLLETTPLAASLEQADRIVVTERAAPAAEGVGAGQ